METAKNIFAAARPMYWVALGLTLLYTVFITL